MDKIIGIYESIVGFFKGIYDFFAAIVNSIISFFKSHRWDFQRGCRIRQKIAAFEENPTEENPPEEISPEDKKDNLSKPPDQG